MTTPMLHKYFDFGDSALANLTLPSGERVLLSIVPSGRLTVRRLHVGGFVPGRRLFRALPIEAERMTEVLARGAAQLPRLPTATRRPRSLFTRLALAADNADDLARRYDRVRNTPE
jgi:hypothetical protein